MAHQVNLSTPPKTSVRLSVMLSVPEKQGEGLYHISLSAVS